MKEQTRNDLIKSLIIQRSYVQPLDNPQREIVTNWITELEALECEPEPCPFKHDELIAIWMEGGDKSLRYFKEMDGGKYTCYTSGQTSKETSNTVLWDNAAPITLFTLHDGKGVPVVPEWANAVNFKRKDGRVDYCFVASMNNYCFEWDGLANDIIGYEFIKVD